MLFFILMVPVAVLIYKKVELLPDNANLMAKKVVSLLVSLAMCLLICGSITEIYYTTELPEIAYDEIDVHPKTPIEIEQYVKQEPIVLMDKDYNLYHIDLDKAEITFSTNNNAAYIKTVKAKGLWKFIVLELSRTSYAIQYMDYYARYSS